jgi:hypothetical protein
MVEDLPAEAPAGDLLGCPPLAELRVLDGKLSHERGEAGVVGVFGGRHSQLGDVHAGDALQSA